MIKRVKLNYMPAVSSTKPCGKIIISSSDLEQLSRVIAQKVCQNERIYQAGYMEAMRHHVGAGTMDIAGMQKVKKR